jgi:uncharacterized CHY-type Zn-finger protein
MHLLFFTVFGCSYDYSLGCLHMHSDSDVLHVAAVKVAKQYNAELREKEYQRMKEL